MTGSELLVGAAAKGVADLISDTTKTGSRSVLGKTIQAVATRSRQAIFNASGKYIETYQKRNCKLSVLGMREPVDLAEVYTAVKLLDTQGVLAFDPGALEDNFRKTRLRGYSSGGDQDQKHSGISIANKKQYLMVLGRPGAGKSTFLRKVGLDALRTFYYERAEYGHRLIPVMLELKRFESDAIDIAKFIASEFEKCGFPEAETFTQNALAQGNLLILLDGLDEVPSANLNTVLRTIHDFVDKHDSNRFIASCRVAASGYRDAAFRRFSHVTMADFDDDQIQQFITNWFGSEQDVERKTADKCWEVLQKPENKASKELGHTPLLLTYLCLVYGQSQRFPNNRSSLYKKALRILLEEWAAEKRILRDEIYEGLSIEQEEILLAEIAYEGMAADQLFFTKRELSTQIRTFLASNLNAPKHIDSEAVLNAIEVQQGILVERAEETYSFSHLTLQEYLTAQYLVDNNEWELLIQQNLTDVRWREIFLLLPGLMTGKVGADKLLLAIEKQSRTYVCSPQLQKIMQWAVIATRNSVGKLTPLAKRVAAVFLFLTLAARDLVLVREHLDVVHDVVLGRELFQAFSHSFNLDLYVPLAYNLVPRARIFGPELDPYFDSALGLALDRSGIFGNVDFCEFVRSLEALKINKPKADVSCEEKARFVTNVSDLWFSSFGIDSEIVMLSQEDSKSLKDYFYACELMIRCKEGAVRVSPEVWEGIESRILTTSIYNKATELLGEG